MLGTIASLFGGPIVDALLKNVTGAFEAYFRKEISIEELRTQVLKGLVSAFADVEKAHAEALAKTYASFMQAMAQSRVMQVVWSAVVVSQLMVLVWHQLGIPAFVYLTGDKYPSSGTTVEWAYLLLAGCLGMGPVVLRNGPGGGAGIAANLKSLVGK